MSKHTKELKESTQDVVDSVQNVKTAADIAKTIDPNAVLYAFGLALLGAVMPIQQQPYQPKLKKAKKSHGDTLLNSPANKTEGSRNRTVNA